MIEREKGKCNVINACLSSVNFNATHNTNEIWILGILGINHQLGRGSGVGSDTEPQSSQEVPKFRRDAAGQGWPCALAHRCTEAAIVEWSGKRDHQPYRKHQGGAGQR